MQAQIFPSILSGTLPAPVSKSSMQRACAAALLHTGETIIHNPGNSNDDLAALDVISKLGASITRNNDGTITIKSEGVRPVAEAINCGESGLGIRMFTPLAALAAQPVHITGSGSLLTRPMDFFDTVLPQAGVTVSSNNGRLPLEIKGPLQPVDITIDGSLSSQFLTGLLFAYGQSVTMPVTITVTNLSSKPYIDLTLDVMQRFGYRVVNENYERFIIYPKENPPFRIDYTVEGDWSGAAFLLVAGAVAGPVTVTGLNVFSTQADKAVLGPLMACGALVSIEETQVAVSPAPLKAFHFNANDCPDLFPPLAALACYCEGRSVIEGVGRLRHKESDRGLTIQEELGKMGVNVTLQDDLMIIDGGEVVKGTLVHSRHDHRIAMACAVAALKASGPVTIDGADAINKSYPGFFNDLKMLGANVSLQTTSAIS